MYSNYKPLPTLKKKLFNTNKRTTKSLYPYNEQCRTKPFYSQGYDFKIPNWKQKGKRMNPKQQLIPALKRKKKKKKPQSLLLQKKKYTRTNKHGSKPTFTDPLKPFFNPRHFSRATTNQSMKNETLQSHVREKLLFFWNERFFLRNQASQCDELMISILKPHPVTFCVKRCRFNKLPRNPLTEETTKWQNGSI